jgi:H+/Cl- antiporter ClcA
MTFTAIKATFFGLIYGTFFAVCSYLMAIGYVAHNEKNLSLTLHQDQNQAVWRASDPIHNISILNISSLIGSPPTIIIEKKRPWLIIAASAAFGILIGLITYRRKNPRIPSIVPATEPEPTPETLSSP